MSELSVEKKDELLVKFLAQGKGSLDFAKEHAGGGEYR